MTSWTRRSVLAAAGGSLALAGCLTDSDGTGGGGATTERTTTGSAPTDAPPAETPTTGGTTGDWIERASNTPDPDHGVSIENGASESATLRVEVVREATGETVFESTERVPPDSEVSVYNLREADPDGVERFRVCAELVDPDGTETGTATATADGSATTAESAGSSPTADAESETTTDVEPETTTADSPRRDCATIATNECYGSAYARFSEDGSVRLIYAIC